LPRPADGPACLASGPPFIAPARAPRGPHAARALRPDRHRGARARHRPWHSWQIGPPGRYFTAFAH